MGSKNLKAVVIDDTGSDQVEVKDRAKFRRRRRPFKGHRVPSAYRDIETVGNWLPGDDDERLRLPGHEELFNRQFQGAEKISGEHMAELMKNRPNGQPVHRCMEGWYHQLLQCFYGRGRQKPLFQALNMKLLAWSDPTA